MDLFAQALFEQLAESPLPGWDLVRQGSRVQRLAQGEYLFRAGERSPHVYVVADGLVKMVYQTSAGQEWTKAFASSGMFFASLQALAPGGSTSFAAQALRPCLVERLDYAVIEQLATQDLAWQRLLTRAFQLYGARKEARELSLLTQTAEERYRCFLQEYPQIAAQIPQKDLAAYIRITPVALSRIRARLRRQAPGT